MGAGSVAEACRAARDGGCLTGVDYEGEYRVDWTNKLSDGLENPVIHSTFGYAAQMVIADPKTGKVEKVVAAHDVGRAVNPLLCEGQIEGSVHMGLGYALSEDFPCDEEGKPRFDTLRGLDIIRAKDMPPVDVILVEAPQPDSPYGIKGVGEIGLGAHRRSGGRGHAPGGRPVAQPAAHQHSSAGSTPTVTGAAPDPGNAAAPLAGGRRRQPDHPGDGVRPPSPVLRAGPGHARTAPHPHGIPGDPGADLVAPGPGPRPRHHRVVGEARRAGSPGVGHHRHHRPSRIPQRHRRIAGRDRPSLRRGRSESGLRLRGDRQKHGPAGARAGLVSRTTGSFEPGGGAMSASTPRSPAPTRPWKPPRAWPPTTAPESTSTCREGTADLEAGYRLEQLARDDWLVVHAVHLDRDLPGTIVHNPRSNMNNAVGYARPAGRSSLVALGTDGIGAAMLDEFRVAYVCHRSDDVTATPETAWSWLEAGWRLFPEALDDTVVWSYDRMDPWSLAFTTGVRAPGSDGRRRDRAARRAGRLGWTPPRSEPKPPKPPPDCSPSSNRCRRRKSRTRRRHDPARSPLHPGRPHPRRVDGSVPLCGVQGLRRGMAGRLPAGARRGGAHLAAIAAVTDTIKVGSGGVVDCWTRNPARLASTFSTLDDLAPGRIILGIGAWWEPLASKVGVSRVRPLKAMREIVEACRGLLSDQTVTFDGEFVQFDGVESSTMCSRSAGPRTCPSTSGPPVPR